MPELQILKTLIFPRAPQKLQNWVNFSMFSYLKFFCVFIIKVTFMWIEKAWVNDCLHVSIVSFVYKQNTLQLSNLKTGIAMTAKSSALAICLEAITYLLLYNLHDCTFNASTILFSKHGKIKR